MSETTSPSGGRRFATRTVARAAVPVVVAGVALGGLSLAPALAGDKSPSLPPISAADLIAKVAQANTQQLHGTLTVSSDLGLPSLPHTGGGGSPLGMLTGDHTVRVAVDGHDKQRLAVLGDMTEQDFIHNGNNAWQYDSANRTASHWLLPADGHGGHAAKSPGDMATPDHMPKTPQDFANQLLADSQRFTEVAVDGTASVAGRPVYTLTLKPKQQGSLIREVDFGVDAKTGVPLRVAVLPSKGGKAALDARFTDVSFSAPSASTFDFTPPAGTKVTEEKTNGIEGSGKAQRPKSGQDAKQHGQVIGEGWTSVLELTGVPGPGALLGGPTAQPSDKPSAGPSHGLARRHGGKDGGAQAQLGALLATGKPVSGAFGTGKLFTTTLVSVLYTDDGRVFVGAVTPDELTKAAASSGKKS